MNMRKFLTLLASFLIDFSLVKSDLFDHAFRKVSETEEELDFKKIHSNGDKLLKRIGVADGEEGKDEKEPIFESKFMRRFASLTDDIEDQVAMESEPKLKVSFSIIFCIDKKLNFTRKFPTMS